VRENDTNPGGTPLPVSTVAGNAGNIGVAVAGSDGGLFTINADGTFDFDANGEFEHLGAGETATTEITYGITFTGAAAVVDVMLLQDLSGSFNEDLPNLRSQFGPLFDPLNEGRDVQFGVAGYVDKPFPPFGNAGDYVYETNLAVSGDKAAIQAALDSLTIGSGGDTPEAQLEALLQVAVRATGEVGFREGAQRIVVLSTDALPHLAGDYTTGANGANDGDAVVGDEDYPSIAQLKAALEEANITPVFSVTADVLTSYQNLVNELGRGVVVELSSSSDNLASAITDALGSVETTDEATLTVTVEGEADPPVASDDSFSTSEDTALSAVSVLANDTDVDDDTLTVTEVNGSPTNVGTQVTLASGALLTVQADGSVAYDPNGAFDSLNDGETATDTFTYTVSDGNGGTDTATASITINGATDAPVSPPSIVLSKSVKIIDIDILRAEHCDNHERHDGKWHGGDHAKHNDDGDKPSVLAKVAYSFEVRNTSADPTDAELKLTSLIDDNGTPDDTSDDFDVADIQKAFIGGDKDCDGLLDVGEVWKFKVTDKVHLRPGTEIVNSAVASALDSDGNAATSLDQASLGLDDIQIVHKARSGSQTERGEEGLRDVFELNANHCGADVIRSFLVADGDAFDFKGSRLKDASVEDGSLALKAGAKGDLTIWANTDKDAVLEKVALVKDFFEDNADALEGLGIDAEGLHGTLSTEVAKPILAAVVKSDLLWA
jgi:VCBS repeat-containing protein